MTVYKGWNIHILRNSIDVGYAKDVTIDIDESLETYFAIQSHAAVKLQEGPLVITGKLSKAWVDVELLTYLSQDTLSEFTLQLTVTPGSYPLTLTGCKFTKGSIKIPQDGFLTEDLDFVARAFEVGEF